MFVNVHTEKKSRNFHVSPLPMGLSKVKLNISWSEREAEHVRTLFLVRVYLRPLWYGGNRLSVAPVCV